MKPIQIILISSLIVIFFYFRYVRSRLFSRFVLMIFTGLGIIFIIFPNLSTKAANLLGVGRGADMIAYIGLLMLFFLYTKSLGDIKELQEKITIVVREIAIQNFQKPNKKKSIDER